MCGISILVTTVSETTWTQVMRLGAGLIGCHALVNWARSRRRLILAATGLTAAGVGLAVLAPFTVDWQRIAVPSLRQSYRVFPLVVSDAVHPNVMGSLMALLLPLPSAWLLRPADVALEPDAATSGRVVLASALLPISLVLLLTTSRGGYIAGATGILVVVLLSVRGRTSLALALASAVAAITAWLLIVAGERATSGWVEYMTDLSTWATRQGIWGIALWMLADFPLTGVGMGTFNDVASALYAYSETQNPGAHNLYLQIGVDLGLPGLIAMLSVLMLTFSMGMVAFRKFDQVRDGQLRAVAVGTVAGLAAMAVHGLTDITVWGTRAAFVPWLMIGLVTALYARASNSAVEQRWNAETGTAIHRGGARQT